MLPAFLRGFGPAVPRPKPVEALRAAMGAAIGLGAAALACRAVNLPLPGLIAPFGASAFLIFAVPNSPLAQPWSVVAGNGLAALAALTVGLLHLPLLAQALVAVALAVAVMAAARAMHPPGGAVALLLALSPLPGGGIAPVLAGSAALVVAGLVWNRMTGRVYPLRQTPAAPHGTADPSPARRHLPPPGALADLLARLRLGANIGVEDLARLITAAEAEAAIRPLAGLTAGHLMSRDLVTVTPATPLPVLAADFIAHRFKTLPVVDNGKYRGLVNEHALTGQTNTTLTAADLAEQSQTATPETPAAALVNLLADGGQQAVPVLEAGHLVGLVTRSDLIALLARPLAAPPPA
ncbi:HPP family protein [Paracoccaceae bacterium]